LLKNAHESGSPADQVSLEVRRLHGAVRIDVMDRGPGMSDTVLTNALVPFYSTKRSGTGLGLALAREIAEAHGGRITLTNREGGGLTVTMILPLVGGRTVRFCGKLRGMTKIRFDQPGHPPATITEFQGVRSLHLGTSWVQGAMRIAKPDNIELEYVQMMMMWLLFNDSPRHVVQLGLGSAALTKFCYRRLPHARVTASNSIPT
jgi:hypothetical protein